MKREKTHIFTLRLRPSARIDLLTLAKLAGKPAGEVVRDLIQEKIAALPSKSPAGKQAN